MKAQLLQQGWKEVELGDILDYEQPTKYIVDNTDYKDEYATPVLTAGKSFVLGHTNEINGIFENLPVIIFDDFTTDSKYVDFKFKVKSSAMKILKPKNKNINMKYVFWAIQRLRFDAKRHKRYYLSAFQHLKIPLPPLQVQKQIVAILEKAEELKQKREESDKLTKKYLQGVFYEMFYNKGFEEIELGDKKICDEIFAGGDVPKNNYSKEITNKHRIPIFTNGEKNKGFYGYTECARVKKPSITISARGTIGYSEIRAENFFPAIRIIVITPKESTLNLYFLKYAVDNLVSFDLSGTSIHQLTVPMIKDYKIPVPPLQLQNKFASIVKEVEKLKEKQKQSKEEINQMFDSLMKQAFNGELVR